MNNVISKRVKRDLLEEGDIIDTGCGLAEVQAAGEGCVSYRHLDSGDYHERTGDLVYTVYLEHPAIGKARQAGRIA